LNGNQVNVKVASATQNGILTKEDWIRFNAGTGTGTAYTLAEPLYFIGNQINVKTSSAMQNGVLSSTKFSQFDAKFGEGSTVNTFLNFEPDAIITFNRNLSGVSGATITFDDSDNRLLVSSIEKLVLQSKQNSIILQRFDLPVSASTMFTEIEMGRTVFNSMLNFNGTNLNFKATTTPTNGQKFLLQYDSSKNTFFFVPA
jgi:hypothetical protein